MSKAIFYNGKRYIKEGEEDIPEEYLWNDDDGEGQLVGGEKYVSPKDKEADSEFEKSDIAKSRIANKYGSLQNIVDMLYSRYVRRYNTPSELKNLLRATYEIIAKRYLESKRSGNENYITNWEKLIYDIPNIATLEEEYMYDPVDELIKTYFYILKTPMYATAFIMAISQRLNELAANDESGENEFDEIKEKLDNKLQEIVHDA